ncbi:MAG: NlpC/P60 family protein [Hyphomicrobiales bacterium]|nr:NlpC/P60 family protein [Hyphomicrobiales bacterium]
MNGLDKRLHAWRDDLADERLKGRIEAGRFVVGRPARVGVPVADMLAEPDTSAGLNTQLLLGDHVLVFEEGPEWAWVQAVHDNYVGYVARSAIGAVVVEATHVVSVPRTFLYSGADLKLPRKACLSMGSRLSVDGFAETRGTRYAMLASGEALIAAHLEPVEESADDYVGVAEALLSTPYLWGGTSAFGIDCSGLVQLSLRMAGRPVPRDTDMQASALGEPLDPGADMAGLRRGDLVFWKGHVAIMLDGQEIIHANGHTMTVSREKLSAAVERIAYLYGGPTGFRRP